VAAGDLIIGPTQKSMEKYLLPVYKGEVKILQLELPKDSAAMWVQARWFGKTYRDRGDGLIIE